MFIAVNDEGELWSGDAWGDGNTRTYFSPIRAIRDLQESGEDIQKISIIEDYVSLSPREN
jgi:hypothetical protein